MTTRPSNAAPILAGLAILLLPLAAYVGGYYWLGEIKGAVYLGAGNVKADGTMVHTDELTEITRMFPNQWQVAIYRPAAEIESLTRGIKVEVLDLETWQIWLHDDSALSVSVP